MKNTYKILLSQIISLVLGYFGASWLSSFSHTSLFDVGGEGFIAFILIPFVYLFLIVLISNLWFQKLNKWNYLIPAILVLIPTLMLSIDSSSDYILYKYYLEAFIGGWILAWIVNFVAGLIKK